MTKSWTPSIVSRIRVPVLNEPHAYVILRAHRYERRKRMIITVGEPNDFIGIAEAHT